MAYYDHGYGRPSVRPRVFLRQAQDKLTLAMYLLGTPRGQSRDTAGRLPGGTPIFVVS